MKKGFYQDAAFDEFFSAVRKAKMLEQARLVVVSKT
jgi:hypothetical protein